MKAEVIESGIVTKNPPDDWRLVRLADICEINPRRPGLSRSDDTLTTFIPMAAVDDITHTVVQPEQKPFASVKRGYTYFAEGDVLFAKITPCMQNGKHAIARNLIDGIGFGSTEFHVLRPQEDITAEWLHFFLVQPSVLEAAMAHFTGAVGQQRVPQSYLAGLGIPLPPLAEQQRILGILNEQMMVVQKAKVAVEAQLGAINQLPAALLQTAFAGKL